MEGIPAVRARNQDGSPYDYRKNHYFTRCRSGCGDAHHHRHTPGQWAFRAPPLSPSTGLSIASVSLALAIGQFMWGAMQPVFGALADSYGAFRVVTFGAVLLAVGSVLTTFSHSEVALIATMGVLSAAGAAAGRLFHFDWWDGAAAWRRISGLLLLGRSMRVGRLGSL